MLVCLIQYTRIYSFTIQFSDFFCLNNFYNFIRQTLFFLLFAFKILYQTTTCQHCVVVSRIDFYVKKNYTPKFIYFVKRSTWEIFVNEFKSKNELLVCYDCKHLLISQHFVSISNFKMRYVDYTKHFILYPLLMKTLH